MEVNKLESKEVLVMLFGLPVMITLIVLVSIGVGHWVTTRSDRPTNVTVSPVQPKVEVNVPQGPAPQVNVSSIPPNVAVNVPATPPPTINVTPPPAIVTVLPAKSDKADDRAEGKVIPVVARPETKPQIKEPAKDIVKETPAPTLPPPALKLPEPTQPIKASFSPDAKGPLLPENDELSLDTLYRYAERYIDAYCSKRSLNAAQETKKWESKWKQGLEQAMKDNTDSDEQSYINRMVVTKRDCFDLEKATPEKIVEACRIFLRYRDGKLAFLQAMKDAITNENMKKTLAFLSAGPQ